MSAHASTPTSASTPQANGTSFVPPPAAAGQSQFPPQVKARVWFLTAANTPVGIALSRQLLRHGDKVVAGVSAADWEARRDAYHSAFAANSRRTSTGNEEDDAAADAAAKQFGVGTHDRFRAFLSEVKAHEGWPARYKIVDFDVSTLSSVQTALAIGMATFGRIEVVLACGGSALLGTVEELGQTPRAAAMVKEQFNSNLFGPINVIKSVLPIMRQKKEGHIILMTGISGHLGTPGLGAYCASQWAIEGYCDSLAYEVAPFNIKISIVQNNLEVGVLTHRISAAPEMPEYTKEHGNEAPLARGLIGGLLTKLSEAAGACNEQGEGDTSLLNAKGGVEALYPILSAEFEDRLIAETVYALSAIGGHENPPARHIVGHDAVASVKEKLKTVSEELEEFLEVSGSVDVEPHHVKPR